LAVYPLVDVEAGFIILNLKNPNPNPNPFFNPNKPLSYAFS
jgi:hypothetical protein